ncbi:hypothetical protein ABZ729_33905, partial [Streptomyces sp. NPDC006678]
GSTTGDPATTGSTTGDPATTGSTTGDPATTGSTTGDPATTGSTTGDPATTGSTSGDPATTGGSTAGGAAATGGSTGGDAGGCTVDVDGAECADNTDTDAAGSKPVEQGQAKEELAETGAAETTFLLIGAATMIAGGIGFRMLPRLVGGGRAAV